MRAAILLLARRARGHTAPTSRPSCGDRVATSMALTRRAIQRNFAGTAMPGSRRGLFGAAFLCKKSVFLKHGDPIALRRDWWTSASQFLHDAAVLAQEGGRKILISSASQHGGRVELHVQKKQTVEDGGSYSTSSWNICSWYERRLFRRLVEGPIPSSHQDPDLPQINTSESLGHVVRPSRRHHALLRDQGGDCRSASALEISAHLPGRPWNR